jgi:hypothetical protein
MIRYSWVAAAMLALLPAVASAEHRDSGRFSFGIGVGLRGGYFDYGRRYEACYAPRGYYSASYLAPAPVYCPPPEIIYEQPVVVYRAPAPEIIYSAPPACYTTTTLVTAPRRYVPVSGPYYYSGARYYYSR